MDAVVTWLAQFGLLAVFLHVGAQQLGLPVPAYPVLILTGALSVDGHYSPAVLMLTAVTACLLADTLWYLAGQRYGAQVLRTLCRISLSPDSCVRQTEPSSPAGACARWWWPSSFRALPPRLPRWRAKPVFPWGVFWCLTPSARRCLQLWAWPVAGCFRTR